MSVPVLQGGPYIFNTNIDIYDTDSSIRRKKVVLEIKNCIVGLGGLNTIWEVVASSNASSVKNIGDADPDLWATYTDIVYATTGSPHSWAVLENKTNGMQLCIDYDSGNLFPYWLHIYISIGGNYLTNGTTTTNPTCSDEKLVWSNAIESTGHTIYSVSVHGMTSANHETLRVIYAGVDSVDSNMYWSKLILIEEVVNTPTEWVSTVKRLVLANPGINPSATASQQSPRLGDISNKWDVYLETSEPYAGWVTCYEAVECYDQIASNQGRLLCNDNNSHGSLGGFPLCNIGLFNIGATRGGSYGRLQDIFFGPFNDGMYVNYPADNSRQWMKFGCLVLPWDGSDPAGKAARDVGTSDNFVTVTGDAGNTVRTVPRLVRTIS